ncbi:hypothetical protein N0V91_010678 [Didymella pomorum]|uniref:Uncharacterized protein n=1 Tax=Didymella pomorum TaxID=749634 RepID=A0A9W8Z0Z2_9PLEO|nr:hypothetical protein N0V91_010678 [Didymella pomorum]
MAKHGLTTSQHSISFEDAFLLGDLFRTQHSRIVRIQKMAEDNVGALARKQLEKLSTITRAGFGKAGDKQSRTMAVSLKMSAASLYILHSGSNDVPSL